MIELDKIKEFLELMKESEERLNEIPSLQSNVDLAISDILHLAETTLKPKSSNANKYFKLLGELRRQRRDLKNEYDKLREFKSMSEKVKGYMENGKMNLGKLKAVQENCVYNVKKLNDMMGDVLR